MNIQGLEVLNKYTALPPETTQHQLQVAIGDKWHELAFFAYNSYLKHGRGIVIWHWHQQRKDSLFYITESILEAKQYPVNMINPVKAYEPKETLVLIISWDNSKGDAIIFPRLATAPEFMPRILYWQRCN